MLTGRKSQSPNFGRSEWAAIFSYPFLNGVVKSVEHTFRAFLSKIFRYSLPCIL